MTDVRRTLLGGLIDYAGLFPPASLDVPGAVEGYRAAREHPRAWLVDRFVAPAALVEQVGLAAPSGAERWPIALVADAPVLRAAAEAAGRVADRLRVDVVELRVLPAAEIAGAIRAARAVFPDATVYAEITPGDVTAIEQAAQAGGGVKLRCGGERVPTAPEVGAVLRACAQHDVRLKATAGLHHPVATTERHGFLNLLAAAALDGDLDAIRETDPDAFDLDHEVFAWQGRSLDAAAARARLAGLGSCSFDEPVEDLVALGILESTRSTA